MVKVTEKPAGAESAFLLEIDNLEAWERLRDIDPAFSVLVVEVEKRYRQHGGKKCKLVWISADDIKFQQFVHWVRHGTFQG